MSLSLMKRQRKSAIHTAIAERINALRRSSRCAQKVFLSAVTDVSSSSVEENDITKFSTKHECEGEIERFKSEALSRLGLLALI